MTSVMICTGQQSYSNYTYIQKSDTYKDIISKAANVIPSDRQLRWQQLELTGFLHFGINTFTGREWGDGTESPQIFNPTALDAGQWVKTCKDAGIKQVILTAKHHDGFCLWPSRYTEHSVKNSPWKNGKGDVVKETAEACRKYGIGFGIYLSPWDRNSDLFGDSAAYNNYFKAQLTELLSNYGRIDEVWFDGANGDESGKKQVYDFEGWYDLIRQMQPQAVIAVMGPDVRWVGTESGYGRATEWSVVPVDMQDQEKIAGNSQKELSFAPKNMMEDDLGSRSIITKAKSLVWYPSEIDVSIRPGWFYHPAEDSLVKTPDKLMDIYFNSVGMNGVLLLNIPPDKRGLIHKEDIKSLKSFKLLLDETFKTNLARQAIITSTGDKNTAALLDKNFSSFWTNSGGDTTATLDIKLNKEQIFDVLMLQENIKSGQRIEKFSLEYKHAGNWLKVCDGTTVGFKRLLKFPAVKASELRLNIESSRLNPVLSEFAIYNMAKLKE